MHGTIASASQECLGLLESEDLFASPETWSRTNEGRKPDERSHGQLIVSVKVYQYSAKTKGHDSAEYVVGHLIRKRLAKSGTSIVTHATTVYPMKNIWPWGLGVHDQAE